MKKILFIVLILGICLLTGCKMKYRISFYESDEVVTYQYLYDGEFATSYVPSDNAENFIGWFTVDDEEFDFSTPINRNINLYARYEEKEWTVTIVYDKTNHDKDETIKVKDGHLVEEPTKPEIEDYIFLGWVDINNEEFDFTKPITSDVSIFAIIVKDIEYTPKLNIKLNSIGGGDFNSLQVRRLDAIGELPVPQKDGYNFLGWYLGDELITSEYIVKEITDFTLLAKYEKIE